MATEDHGLYRCLESGFFFDRLDRPVVQQYGERECLALLERRTADANAGADARASLSPGLNV
jgi:hypothetical protein